MYISGVHLKNIRCFGDLEICFDLKGQQLPWTMLIGDNAAGKTAFLKSIAIGLCDETSAAALLKESEEGYIRRGQQQGEIIIRLKTSATARNDHIIHTKITKSGAGDSIYEQVRQTTKPRTAFPRSKILVCAYGAGRGTSGTGDIAGYSVINGVYNLFNYNEGLQNPELTLKRIKKTSSRDDLLTVLKNFMLRQEDNITLPRSGIMVDGPWGGKMPLRDLADGFKSSFLWITDFFGWAISQNPKLTSCADITGIVLIDEIEQHLHPTWQDRIVRDLRRLFPKVQFITTTHSAIVASSVGQITDTVDRDNLVVLEIGTGNMVSKSELPPMMGWSVDQVLASRAFRYLIRSTPDLNKLLHEASLLTDKGSARTLTEQRRYENLKKKISILMLGEGKTSIEREIEDEGIAEIRKNIKDLEGMLFGDDK